MFMLSAPAAVVYGFIGLRGNHIGAAPDLDVVAKILDVWLSTLL